MKAANVGSQDWWVPCANYVSDAIYARHGDSLARFGAKGREICHQDVLHHLAYLQSALVMLSPAPFVQYVLWLRDVLKNRGIPTEHLALSLDLIETFLAPRLQAQQQMDLKLIMDAARHNLHDTQAIAHYGFERLPPLVQAPQYQQLILQGQRNSAGLVLKEAMAQGATLTEASVRIVQPALYEVGRLWQHNLISVSKEHLASAISQNALVSAYMAAKFSPPNGKNAVFACVQGNHHALGLRMLSDAFETQGWGVVFLGADVPMADLVRDIDTRRPDLLALSVALPEHLGTARQTIEMLHSELGKACPTIWIGGLATLCDQGIWRNTRADGWASDALHAQDQL